MPACFLTLNNSTIHLQQLTLIIQYLSCCRFSLSHLRSRQTFLLRRRQQQQQEHSYEACKFETLISETVKETLSISMRAQKRQRANIHSFLFYFPRERRNMYARTATFSLISSNPQFFLACSSLLCRFSFLHYFYSSQLATAFAHYLSLGMCSSSLFACCFFRTAK